MEKFKQWIKNVLLSWWLYFDQLNKAQILSIVSLLAGVGMQVSTAIGVPHKVAIAGGLLSAVACAALPAISKAFDLSWVTLLGVFFAMCVGLQTYFVENAVEVPGWLVSLITLLAAVGRGLRRVPVAGATGNIKGE